MQILIPSSRKHALHTYVSISPSPLITSELTAAIHVSEELTAFSRHVSGELTASTGIFSVVLRLQVIALWM